MKNQEKDALVTGSQSQENRNAQTNQIKNREAKLGTPNPQKQTARDKDEEEKQQRQAQPREKQTQQLGKNHPNTSQEQQGKTEQKR